MVVSIVLTRLTMDNRFLPSKNIKTPQTTASLGQDEGKRILNTANIKNK